MKKKWIFSIVFLVFFACIIGFNQSGNDFFSDLIKGDGDGMQDLVDGIKNYQKEVHEKKKQFFQELASGQNPNVLLVACSDSRVDPQLLTQSHPGSLFNIRNVGNIVPENSGIDYSEPAAIEYAISVLGVEHIVILGHSDCGAMKALLSPPEDGALPHVVNWLGRMTTLPSKLSQELDGKTKDEQLKIIIQANVIEQLKHLESYPIVQEKVADGSLELHGWVFDIGSGNVAVYESENGEFTQL